MDGRDRYTFEPQDFDQISSEAKHFIRSILVADPCERPTITQLLADPWIRAAADRLSSPLPRAQQGIDQIQAGKRWTKGIASALVLNRVRRLSFDDREPQDELQSEEVTLIFPRAVRPSAGQTGNKAVDGQPLFEPSPPGPSPEAGPASSASGGASIVPLSLGQNASPPPKARDAP